MLYLLKKEYRRDNAYRYLCVLLFLLFLPVFVNPINKMWHTGSYQAFPLRFGFILIFLGLLLGGILIQSINLDQPAAKSKGWAILILLVMLGLYGGVIYMLSSHDFDTLTRYTKKLWVPEDTYKLLLFFCLLYTSFLLCSVPVRPSYSFPLVLWLAPFTAEELFCCSFFHQDTGKDL